MVNLLGRIAERKKATPAQIALAWLLGLKPWIVPIPGTTKLHRLEENMAATAVKLTHHDLRDIDDAASKIAVQGLGIPRLRYNGSTAELRGDSHRTSSRSTAAAS